MKLVCSGIPRRQAETITLAAQGLTEKETARAMDCSVANVQSLRTAIFCRYGSRNMVSAVAEAFRRGHLKYIPSLALAFFAAFGTALPPTPHTDDDLARRLRGRATGRAIVRLRGRDQLADALAAIEPGLSPAIGWDGELFVTVERTAA